MADRSEPRTPSSSSRQVANDNADLFTTNSATTTSASSLFVYGPLVDPDVRCALFGEEVETNGLKKTECILMPHFFDESSKAGASPRGFAGNKFRTSGFRRDLQLFSVKNCPSIPALHYAEVADPLKTNTKTENTNTSAQPKCPIHGLLLEGIDAESAKIIRTFFGRT